MAAAGEFGPSAWQTARAEWTLFCTFRTTRAIPRSVVEPLTLAAFAQSRLETFVAEEAHKPTNRRSGASIPSSVTTMARVYARMNGVELPLLLSGGLRALTRASSKSDQIRSGGKSYPITRELLDLIIPFVLQPGCPQWLSLVLTRESVS